MINPLPRPAASLAVGVAGLVLLAGPGGCNAITAVIAKAGENPTIPAVFKLKKVPTVIFCENFRSPDLLADDAELLGRELQDKLEKKKAAPIIPAEKIQDLRNTKPKEFTGMTTPQVGKAVGAEQVIYVDLQGGGVGSMTGQSLFQGRANCSVRVIDVKTGDTLFPPDSADGVGRAFETDPIKGKDEGSYQNVRAELYEGLATEVSHLFVDWKRDPTEE